MINSKALKFLPKRLGINKDKEASGIKKVFKVISNFFLFEVYYPVESFFVRTHERISRSIAYAKFGYMHYDFDSGYLYDLMEFKLKRIYKCLENGHAIQEKEDMDALKETIKICHRLHEQKYDNKYHAEHDKKWGKMPRWESKPAELDKNGKPLTYEVVFKDRPKVKNKKQKAQERKEFMACWVKAEEDRIKDLDRLSELLKKHERKWWD